MFVFLLFGKSNAHNIHNEPAFYGGSRGASEGEENTLGQKHGSLVANQSISRDSR